MFDWFKPKKKRVEVGYGWASYSNEYVTIKHDRENSKWVFMWEDEYIDRPAKYDVTKSYITFTLEATDEEKEYVRQYLTNRAHLSKTEVF
jgi:hypothetical protein